MVEQSRRHAFIVSLLRDPQMVLAVNTMDGSDDGREATLDESAALADESDHG